VGKKIESREDKGSVKIWELDSNNSDVYNESSVESDTDELLEYYPCTFAPLCFLLFVFFTQPL